MRKILYFTVLGLLFPLFANSGTVKNFDEQATLDQLGMSIYKTHGGDHEKNIKQYLKYEPNKFADWILRTHNPEKYAKVKDDEFELGDALQQALDQFIKEVNAAEPINKKTLYQVEVPAKLGKYDFKEKGFPVVMKIDRKFLRRSGFKGKVVGGYILYLGTEEQPYLKMDKKAAKAFMTSRKEYGDMERDVIVKADFALNDAFFHDSAALGTDRRLTMHAISKVKSITIIDPKTKEVLSKSENIK